MMNWILTTIVAIGLSSIAYVRTDGFSPSQIQATLVSKGSLPSAETTALLSQSFHYLGKGRQCFVFESQDQKYVLKFFNQKYLQTPWYGFGENPEKRERRRHFYENSYRIAYSELGDQILYLHLAATVGLPTLHLKDKASRSFSLDLNQIPFVLQKKGIPFYSALEEIYIKEGREGLFREIDTFLAQIAFRISKNIADWDQDVEHNWGYVDGTLFHLDPGRLFYDESLKEEMREKTEWTRGTRKFHKWLSLNYPEAAEYLSKCLKK